jgi:hypothetical protein
MTTFAPLGESLRSFSSNGELPLPFSEVRKGDAVAVHEEEAHGLAMKKARILKKRRFPKVVMATTTTRMNVRLGRQVRRLAKKTKTMTTNPMVNRQNKMLATMMMIAKQIQKKMKKTGTGMEIMNRPNLLENR